MLPRTSLALQQTLRRAEIEQIDRFVASTGEARSLVILGPSGIGKSTLLRCINAKHSGNVAARLDLGAPLNRSALGVASSLLAGLDSHSTERFFKVASAARTSAEERLTRDALTVCEELFPQLAGARDLILLDNLDRASARVRTWLFESVFSKAKVRVISAARTLPGEVADASTIDVLPFGHDRLLTLAQSWSGHIGQPPDDVLDQLSRLSQGHPVRAELIGWALSCIETSDSGANHDLSKLLFAAWRSLPAADQGAICAAVSARYRVNEPVINELAPGGRLDAVAELPFAVPIEDSAGGWVVHPVALDQLEVAIGIEPTVVAEFRRTLTDRVYPRLLASNLSSEVRSALGLERLRYLATSPASDGFAEIEEAFRDALQRGELWHADEVAQVAVEVLESPLRSLKIRSALVAIENSIAHHYVAEALEHIGRINRAALSRAPAPVRIRLQLLKAKCVTSPAATSGREIFSVSGALEAALADAIESGVEAALVQEIRFELGQAYRLAARYEDALRCFSDIEAQSADAAARVRAIEEQGQFYRHMQDLGMAEASQARAALARVENELKITVHGLYALATLRRDENNFIAADRLYSKALAMGLDECDDYLVCNIRGDIAWMKFLDGDLKASRDYLREYERLAEFYNFSRELAECWHMRYHLEAEAGDWSAADSSLDTALNLATDFGNIVMQLDCLMHRVQRTVRDRRLEEAEAIIGEMAKIEKRGCGIRVYRGRARIYQGDGLFAAKKERDAALAWKEGFEIVALHGQSRSNAELLGSLINERRHRFLAVLERFPDVAPGWPDECPPATKARIEEALAL